MRLLILIALTAGAAFGQDVVLPEGKAKDIVQQACADCHGLDTVVSNPMTAEKWRATVKTMVKRGASLSAEQIDLVVDYLSVYFAPDPVNVNKATSTEIQTALEFTAAEADAIVAYRKAHGNFKDLSALGKVDGLDSKKLESKKDLISF